MIAFVVVPVSYSWVLVAGHVPSWLYPVIAVAEWGGLAVAVVAVWLGRRARAAGAAGAAAIWAPRIGIATIVVYLATFVALLFTYR